MFGKIKYLEGVVRLLIYIEKLIIFMIVEFLGCIWSAYVRMCVKYIYLFQVFLLLFMFNL